jgi:hypothetical protein
MNMSQQTREITPGRKALFYGGMLVVGLGIALFLSTFFDFASEFGRESKGPELGEPGWWEGAQKEHRETGERMGRSFARAVVGMIFAVLGMGMMSVGRRGAAGAGIVLDPQQAREDLEPWSRMKGGMMQDGMEELHVVRKMEESFPTPAPQIKVRCPSCKALNDENDRFCGQCGSQMQ